MSRPWSIVLAGGNGQRVHSLTTDRDGVPVPKQYCRFPGSPSLLRLGLERAARVCSWRRIMTVVAAQHARWWTEECADLPSDNVIVQPRNCGTAPGVLLPLLAVLDRDPDPTLVVIPSDHYVADEDLLAGAVRRALTSVAREPDELVLVGMPPTEFDPGLGWIVPAAGDRVESFVEKPHEARAAELFARGAMWNSFIFAVRGRTLLDLYERRLPLLLGILEAARAIERTVDERPDPVSFVYDDLETSDFSRDLLQGSEDRLSVVRANPCGWSDLGTKERVERCVGRFEVPVVTRPSPGLPPLRS